MKDRRVEVSALAREGPHSEAPVCRVGEALMQSLGSSPGDLVEIRGRRSAAAKLVLVPGLEDGTCEVDPKRLKQAGVEGEGRVRLAATSRRYARRVILSPDTSVLDMIALEDGDPSLVGLPVVRGSTLHNPVTGKTAFVIRETFPSGVVCLGPETHYSIIKPGKAEKSMQVSSLDLGGLRFEIHRLRDLLDIALNKPEVFENLALSAPKVFLITGPAGSGKSVLIEALAFEVKASKLQLSFPRIAMNTHERPQNLLARTLEEAKRNLPALVVLEDLDGSSHQAATVEAACALLADVRSRARVAAVLTCRDRSRLPKPLWDLCDDLTELSLPDLAGREEILRILSRHVAMQDVDFGDLAAATSGAVGADLDALLREATLIAYQEAVDDARADKQLVLNREHFEIALRRFQPRHQELAASVIPLPGGLAELLPGGGLAHNLRRLMLDFDVPQPRGVLLHGPTGSGKSTCIAGLAFELPTPVPCVRVGPELDFAAALAALQLRLARGDGGIFAVEDADRLRPDQLERLARFIRQQDPRWQALVTARDAARLGDWLRASGCLEAELALEPPEGAACETFLQRLFGPIELKKGLSFASMAKAVAGLWPEQLIRVARHAIDGALAASDGIPRLGSKQFKAALARVQGEAPATASARTRKSG